MAFRVTIRRDALRADSVAGLVLGLQSIPDGLATGLLAGVSPLSGLYGYLVGTITGAAFASSAFMAVQGTGAMAIIVADVPAVHGAADSERALFTLAVLTGVVMLAAGMFRLGSALRFVSNSVMVGFINAVGVNIVLGQLANFTGYGASGANRIMRALNTFLHPGRLHWQTLLVGIVTIALIVVLERTRLRAMGLVVAVIVTSGLVPLLGWSGVATLSDLTVVPNSLPRPVLPVLHLVPSLLVPAIALTFVGLVQGAVVSAAFPNPDGTVANVSADFRGQGAANVAAGLFRGMPVGGSLSASSLNKAAGARTRQSLIIAGVVMAIAIVALGGLIGRVAMPALAGLLMLVGYRTIKPADILATWRTGAVQATVLTVTFVLTILIPLQYAVLVGVGLSVLLHAVRQSNQLVIKRRVLGVDGHWIETDAPVQLQASDIVVLQPYGSLFFAAAATFETALPQTIDTSSGSVVIIRLRGRTDLGTTFLGVLSRYAEELASVGSKLVVVSASERIDEQLSLSGVTDVVGHANIYSGDERVGAALAEAYADAASWVEAHRTEAPRS